MTFDNVLVPVKYRISGEGKAWTYSQFLLEFERTSYAGIGIKRKELADLLEIAKAEPIGGNVHDAFAARLKEANIALDALEMTVLRLLSVAKDGGRPGKEVSIIKVIATETAQRSPSFMSGRRPFTASVSCQTASAQTGPVMRATRRPAYRHISASVPSPFTAAPTKFRETSWPRAFLAF